MRRKRIPYSLYIAFAILLLTSLGWLIARSGFARATLLVEAQLLYKGEVRPVANATLYLLDRDMMKLALVLEGEANPLQERVFKEHPALRNLAGVMNARRRESYALGPEVVPFMEQSQALWQPHVVQTTRTDAEGGARFVNLEPGDYWLACRVETPSGGVAFWNLFVTVKRGDNSIRLEPLNSLQCSSCE